MRCGGTPHWKEPEVAAALSDRLAALRSAGRVGGVAGNWRMRIDQGRNVTRKLRRLASCGGLALACRRRHRSPQSERTDPGPFRYGRAGSDGRGWGGAAMMVAGRPAKLLLIDSNVFFSNRRRDALKPDGFQPTQMLAQADTSLSGSLTHHDLPGVMQMLGHAHQTGALHINAGETDAVLFFDAGEITHAECGNLFGDEAVIHILKNCVQGGSGVYKFVYGAASTQRTVLRSATDLMLDAMREYDESVHDTADKEAL